MTPHEVVVKLQEIVRELSGYGLNVGQQLSQKAILANLELLNYSFSDKA